MTVVTSRVREDKVCGLGVGALPLPCLFLPLVFYLRMSLYAGAPQLVAEEVVI